MFSVVTRKTRGRKTTQTDYCHTRPLGPPPPVTPVPLIRGTRDGQSNGTQQTVGHEDGSSEILLRERSMEVGEGEAPGSPSGTPPYPRDDDTRSHNVLGDNVKDLG